MTLNRFLYCFPSPSKVIFILLTGELERRVRRRGEREREGEKEKEKEGEGKKENLLIPERISIIPLKLFNFMSSSINRINLKEK